MWIQILESLRGLWSHSVPSAYSSAEKTCWYFGQKNLWIAEQQFAYQQCHYILVKRTISRMTRKSLSRTCLIEHLKSAISKWRNTKGWKQPTLLSSYHKKRMFELIFFYPWLIMNLKSCRMSMENPYWIGYYYYVLLLCIEIHNPGLLVLELSPMAQQQSMYNAINEPRIFRLFNHFHVT